MHARLQLTRARGSAPADALSFFRVVIGSASAIAWPAVRCKPEGDASAGAHQLADKPEGTSAGGHARGTARISWLEGSNAEQSDMNERKARDDRARLRRFRGQ